MVTWVVSLIFIVSFVVVLALWWREHRKGLR